MRPLVIFSASVTIEAWQTNRLRLSLIAVLTAVSFSAVHAAPPGWDLTWSDEFDGSSLDTTKWDPIYWNTPHNNEQQAYRPERATVSGGNLVLTADHANNGGKDYTSGKVESKIANQYGRWEIRAKLPGTQGTWPAIWLLPDTNTYPWPTQGEIDIMENRGNQPNLTSSAFHYGQQWPNNQFRYDEQITSQLGQLDDYHNDFHTYAVEWDSKKIRFFVDEVNYFTLYDQDVNGYISNQAPMEVNLNVAVGGDFLGGAQPNGSSVWPQQMLVDYVRVYEKSQTTQNILFKNGGFEDNGGSLAGWSTFGNNLQPNPNVQVHDEAVDEGVAALKLFGQFNNQTNYSGVTQGISVSPGDSLSAMLSTYISSADSIAGSQNQLEMKFDYYKSFDAKYGSGEYLSSKSIVIANGSTVNDAWLDHVLTDTVPAQAVEARLSLVFTQPNNQGGAVHIDDVSFMNLSLTPSGDFDGDGDVDGHDFLVWQRDPNVGSLSNWQNSVGTPLTANLGVVPEPSTCVLGFLLAFAVSSIGRRRNTRCQAILVTSF
ncbi:Beta-glucanase precursor [Bythopirellula polymerisocia]|uniref:Beta-glucanase n=1 Tax=Bythopirellula polymerisocia TaxID=2528003 RepID=A0A5C6CZG7_9BACT|nr:Beta-glucanase precursor [Bythopirellula polymerisocia]